MSLTRTSAGDTAWRWWRRRRCCGRPGSASHSRCAPNPAPGSFPSPGPQTRSRPCRVLRGPFTVLTATSGQGGLHHKARAGPALAGDSFPCPRCVNTGVSAPGCIRDALPHRHGPRAQAQPAGVLCSGSLAGCGVGRPGGPARVPAVQFSTGRTSPQIAGLRAQDARHPGLLG